MAKTDIQQKRTTGRKQPAKKTAGSNEGNRNQSAGLADVMVSRMWYRDQYRRGLFLSCILAVMLCFSLLANILQIMASPEPRYFAATPDLKLVSMTPLDQPSINQQGLLNWTTRVVGDSLSLTFTDYRNQLMNVRPNYFEDAFQGLVRSMKDAGMFEALKERVNVKVGLEGSPVITNKGVLQGRMSWKIEFPIIRSYESSGGTEGTQHLLAKALVQRVDTTKHPRGVKIRQLILKNAE